jgi:hypothetical protein
MSKTYDEESNRDRLRRILTELEEIGGDEVISPTPFEFLMEAQAAIINAMRFVLDVNERDGVAS